eukprot:GHVT01030928.1.p1 GENE.GHVT01030928.1~~GHVT01030928.1.p1  ORF type:complete len:129 (+),score=5.38 GHVT01030928.1:174-560(+)
MLPCMRFECQVLEDRIPEFFELATYVMTKANLGSQSMALAILKQIAIDFTFSDNTWKTDKTSAAILATSCVTVRSALDSYISGPNSILKMHELVKEVTTTYTHGFTTGRDLRFFSWHSPRHTTPGVVA